MAEIPWQLRSLGAAGGRGRRARVSSSPDSASPAKKAASETANHEAERRVGWGRSEREDSEEELWQDPLAARAELKAQRERRRVSEPARRPGQGQDAAEVAEGVLEGEGARELSSGEPRCPGPQLRGAEPQEGAREGPGGAEEPPQEVTGPPPRCRAVPRSSRRPAAELAAGAALEVVVGALRRDSWGPWAAATPKARRRMLADAAKPALSCAPRWRHALQEGVVRAIGEALELEGTQLAALADDPCRAEEARALIREQLHAVAAFGRLRDSGAAAATSARSGASGAG